MNRLTHVDKRVNTVSRELHAYLLLKMKNVPGLKLLEIDYQKSSDECLFLMPLCKSFASASLKNLWALLIRSACCAVCAIVLLAGRSSRGLLN